MKKSRRKGRLNRRIGEGNMQFIVGTDKFVARQLFHLGLEGGWLGAYGYRVTNHWIRGKRKGVK